MSDIIIVYIPPNNKQGMDVSTLSWNERPWAVVTG